ncbi:hypothetical protein OIX85_003851 [Vibrio parahaemolyticus]|nr:hypothetical protein [Vibrio parahaemolyticus]
MSFYYTESQRESAREALIAAYVGVASKFELTLESENSINTVSLKKPSHETHIISGKEKRQVNPKPLISDRHFEQAKLLKQVKNMSSIAQAWIDTAYHSKNPQALENIMESLFYERFKVRSGTESIIPLVVDVSIKKALADILDMNKINDSQIAIHLGRSRRAYRDNWKPKVDYLYKLLIDLDLAIIERVCSILGYSEYAPSIKPRLNDRNTLMQTSKPCGLH